jgi:hypothetical protein
MTGNPENAVTQKIKDVYKSCPSAWSDLAVGYGEYGLAVDMIEKRGGSRFIDSFIPPHSLIQLVYLDRWPDCSKKRAEAGYPRLVKRPSGVWEFESDCEPCRLERDAAEQRNKPFSLEDHLRELEKREKAKKDLTKSEKVFQK